MGVLHTVNKSPFERTALQSCLRVARAGSALLLYEDAVYAALAGTAFEPAVCAAAQRLRVFVLEPDLEARGVHRSRLVEAVQRVDYAGFVDLAIEHDNVSAWL